MAEKEDKKTEEVQNPLADEGFVKPKVKQAVIAKEDVGNPTAIAIKTEGPKGFKVKVAGLRGQYQAIRFGDDSIAENVDETHLSALKGHFGDSAVEILPGAGD